MQISRRAVRRLPWILVVLAIFVAGLGVATAQGHQVTARPGTRTVVADPEPTPVVHAGALGKRIAAHLLIVSPHPLSPAQVAALVKATGAKAALAVSAGTVTIGTGRTMALGVDPGVFRAWTPPGTADSNAVWDSVAAGDGAVAHVVGRAFEVPLGGTVTAQVVVPVPLRVGSFATTAIPGVGLVVDNATGTEMGLVRGTGLLLSIPQRSAERGPQGCLGGPRRRSRHLRVRPADAPDQARAAVP